MADRAWEKMWALFHEISALPRQERSEALRLACPNDSAMLAELEQLLAASEETSPLDQALSSLFELAAGFEGRLIGPWLLLHELGRGGDGAVYLARRDDGAYNQQVAIKFMARHRDETARQRFHTERELLARLDHPFIARLIDAGETNDGIPYLVMEYVEGQPIHAWCKGQPAALQDRLTLLIKVCEAVQFAHQHLIVHRDLKPGNVLVTAEGQPKLLDFGIARPLDQPREVLANLNAMTPDYASPEQVMGTQVTTASDVYSLGVLLYQLLSDQRPFDLAQASLEKVVEAVCHTTAAAPSSRAPSHRQAKIRGDLDAIVGKAMARLPQDRYGSPQELAGDLGRHLEDHPVQARGTGRLYRLGRFVRRHRLGVAVTASVLVALITLSGSLYVQGKQLSVALSDAEAQTRRSSTAFQFLADLLVQADPETNQGDPLTVAQVLDQGAQQMVTRFQSEPTLQSELSGTVGEIYLHLGEIDSAEQFFNQALSVDGNSSAALAGLALVADSRGDPIKGEALQRQVIALLSQNGDAGQLAEARLRLAALLQDQSRLEDAEVEMTAALAEPVVGPLAAARARIRFGSLRWAQGNMELAAEQYQLALITFTEQLGSQHHETARAHYALGATRHYQGNYQAAESHYQKSLTIRESVYGPTHPLVARVLEALGGLLYDAGRSKDSLRPSTRALQLQQSLYGADAPRTTRALNHLALAQHDLGDFQLAMENQRRGLHINIGNYGPNHALVAGNYNNLGLILLDLGKPEQAMTEFQSGLQIHQKIYAPNHPSLAYSAHFIGRAHLQLGDLDTASRWLNNAIEARSKLRDGRHPQLADSLIWRSVLHTLQNNLAGAIEDAELALNIRRENLLDGDWRLAEAKVTAATWALLVEPNRQPTGTPDDQPSLALLNAALNELNAARGGHDWKVAAIVSRLTSAACQDRSPALAASPGNHPLCRLE